MGPEPLGGWAPLTVGEAVRLFEGAPFRWWIAGGHALELHLGESWRSHEDLDVGIVRGDAVEAHAWLDGWDPWLASQNRLTPWSGRPLVAADHENNVWVRRDRNAPWALDLTIGDGTPGGWVHRRAPRVALAWDEAVLRSDDGTPYLAPEVQLLFKSKGRRPKDAVDAGVVIPRLDGRRRRWLWDHLPRTHPWRALVSD